MLLPAAARAQVPITHCRTVVADSVLVADVVAQPGGPNPCLQITADHIRLNLNGRTIDVRPLGPTGTALAIEGANDVVIEGGSAPGIYANVLASFIAATAGTGWPAAVIARDSRNLSIRNLRIVNSEPARSWCGDPAQRRGVGLWLHRVAAARIFANTIECFQVGLLVSDSNAGQPAARIEYNALLNNSNPTAPSAGLALVRVTGWRVEGNFVTGSGSRPQPALNGSPGVVAGALTLLDSRANLVHANTVQNNPGPGVVIAGQSSTNQIAGNTAQNSLDPVAHVLFPDLWDQSGGNRWTQNVCSAAAGRVGPQHCPLNPDYRPGRLVTSISVFQPH